MARAEGLGGSDVELHLHPAERAVGVLPPGSARCRGPPRDLREREIQSSVHVQRLVTGHPNERRRTRVRSGAMDYRHLGRSGMLVSALSYGNWITHGSQIEEDAAAACVKAALDVGITTFDTADVYAIGRGRVRTGPGAQARAAGVRRDLHQGLLADGAQPQRPRPVAQAHHGVAPRVARAVADRPRRSPPGPPLRLRGPPGGDLAGLRRPGAPGQGPLHRRLGVDGGPDPGRAPAGRRNGLRPHRLEPAAVLHDLAGDRGRGRPAVPEGGRGPDRVVTPRPGRPHRQVPPGLVRPARRARGPPGPRAAR